MIPLFVNFTCVFTVLPVNPNKAFQSQSQLLFQYWSVETGTFCVRRQQYQRQGNVRPGNKG
jgi:hypothetical protein